jgi:signal transduction histidine kinase
MNSVEAGKDLEERAVLLYEASRLLGAPLNWQASFDALLTGILHRYRLCAALLYADSGNDELTCEYAAGVSDAFTRSVALRPGVGVAGVVFASGQARLLPEVQEIEPDPFLREMVRKLRVGSTLLLPLRVEGRVIGIAVYGSKAPKNFTDADVQALGVLSDHLALALHNGRRASALEATHKRLEFEVATTVRELTHTNERLVRKVRELKTVYDLALATAASTQVDQIVRVIIAGIKELVELQGGAFFLFQGDSDTLEPVMPAFDLPPRAAESLAFKLGESKFLESVVRQRQPQILNLVDSETALPLSWKGVGIRSILALPLQQDETAKGLFCVINKANGLFTSDDIRLLSLLTSRVAELLRRLALDQQLRQRVNDLSVLQEIGAQLPSPPVLADTVGAIGRIARQALGGADLCLFFLYHAESEALAMMGGDWDPRLAFDARALTVGISEKMPLAEVFRESQPAFYESGSSPARWEEDPLVKALDLHHLLYLPLTIEQGRIGVLAIGTKPPRTLSLEHRRLVGLVAKQVAIVVERSRLYERLRLANEKLEQINHLKNEFISMVSHELRTPLTTIKGFVSIVLNEETGPLNDQQRRFLETSDRAIDRLTLLVSDLLDISRIEAGQIKMQLRPVALHDVCQRVATGFAPQVKAQNLTLTLQVPENLPLVMADPDRLGQVLDNLISNALKFTSRGGLTISAADKGDYAMVSVKDTGAGIPKEEQEKIFDKFYQAKTGKGFPSKGTGLGLAIVRSIIDSHRGKVWVESEPGKGADFRFILPRARMEGAQEKETKT